MDGVGSVISRTPAGDSVRFVFRVSEELKPFITPKGSVCLNGVSLTVNEVRGNRFGVNLIPHTLENTTFGAGELGERVNVEIDMLARYVARLTEVRLG